jgi:nitrate reductase delta subunit
MLARCAVFDALAELLAYPANGKPRRFDGMPEAIRSSLGEFADRLDGFSPEEVEESYTRTFDLNPVCSLEVGWHLYGENYSRGEFLVLMRGELRKYGLAESTELPDHLTHVLRVLGRMPGRDADKFAVTYVIPALEKMRAGIAGKNSPYEHLLEAVYTTLLADIDSEHAAQASADTARAAHSLAGAARSESNAACPGADKVSP